MISAAQLAGGEKGRPVYDLEAWPQAHGGHWVILTGCRKGAVPAALAAASRAAARGGSSGALAGMFGRQNVVVELTSHDQPADDERNDALYELAASTGTPWSPPATCTTPPRAMPGWPRRWPRSGPAAAWMRWTAGWLPPAPRYLRSGAEMARRLRRYPGVAERTVRAGRGLRVRLPRDRAPAAGLPGPRQAHRGDLAALAGRRARRRSATARPAAERVEGAYAQIARELDVIEALGFPGYFLIVHDIVRFCEHERHPVPGQGLGRELGRLLRAGDHRRGSGPARPAFRAVPVSGQGRPARHRPGHRAPAPGGGDPVRLRQVRPGQGRPGRQRDHLPAADGAAGRGPGARATPRSSWTRGPSRWAPAQYAAGPAGPGGRGRPGARTALAARMQRLPRHLGIHSGGMVICDRPVGEVCPVEWARMPGRSVLQWDKDDCAYAGLVKFDLLGLGMLTALRDCFELVAAASRRALEPALDPAGGPRRLRHAVRGGHRGGVPGRVPGPDGDPAPAAAPEVLRPGGRGRADPAGPDPGRLGAPLHAPAPRRRAAGPAARVDAPGPGQDPRRPAVPGADDAARDRLRRVHARPRRTGCGRR